MQGLPLTRLEAFQFVQVRVSRFSTIRVSPNLYSVASRRIGATVEVRLYPEHLEVRFTRLAERDARRSVVITSNLGFRQWDQRVKDPMTTAAAVDRVVHHAVILELSIPSYWAQAAKARRQAPPGAEGT